MRLITPYAPGSFLKPCIIVSTIYVPKGDPDQRSTAVCFVSALHQNHALAMVYGENPSEYVKKNTGDFTVIQEHRTERQAIAYHIALVKPFVNGGDQASWDKGWEPYLALYERWCPPHLRDTLADEMAKRAEATADVL